MSPKLVEVFWFLFFDMLKDPQRQYDKALRLAQSPLMTIWGTR